MIDHPITRVLMMLWCAGASLWTAKAGDAGWAYAMIVCTCWWMFRIWEGLRSQKHGEGQP